MLRHLGNCWAAGVQLISSGCATRVSVHSQLRVTKDGRAVAIRPVTVSDTDDLVALDLAVVKAGHGVVMRPDEVQRGNDARRLNEHTLSEIANGGGVWLIAHFADGTGSALGQAGARRFRPSFVGHVASLSLGVHPEVQGLGIGRMLLEAVMAWADDVAPPIERLELYVRDDNLRARRLYESCGFAPEGVRKRFIKLPSGAYVDDWIMVRFSAAR